MIVLSMGAGVPLTCQDCGASMMAGLTDRGAPQLLHAVPVCAAFTAKAMESTERWVRSLRDARPPSESEAT